MLRRLLVLGTASGVLVATLAGATAPAQASVTQTAACTDGGGVRWSGRVTWDGVRTSSDGVQRVSVLSAAWTTGRPGSVPTDATVRTYTGAGQLAGRSSSTRTFDYGSGRTWDSRNPHDPVRTDGAAGVKLSLGLDGDGFGGCTMTFTQPAAGQTAAPVAAPAATTACRGTAVTPSSDLRSVVDQAAPGTTFCFAPGTYHASIRPKSGQVFDGGRQAAVLDGQHSLRYAFVAPGTTGVTIRGFVVRNYQTPLQQGAIHTFDTHGWTIERNHITGNAAAGVTTDSGARVLDNLIDHNRQEGFAAHGSDVLYEGNEIAYNNERLAVDPTWEAGGGKAWATRNATFRGNKVHHNGGNGLWDDTNNIFITYDRNVVSDNWGAGIYHEIGYDASITGNVVTNNGTSSSQGGGERKGWLWDAGIQLRSSGGRSASTPIVISGNTVTDNYNGIALLDSPASGCLNTRNGEGAYGPCRIRNVVVQGNRVTMREGGTGVVQDGSGSDVFSTRNVRFHDNHYTVPSTSHPRDGHAYGWFAWHNTWPSWDSWKSAGNDGSGSLGS